MCNRQIRACKRINHYICTYFRSARHSSAVTQLLVHSVQMIPVIYYASSKWLCHPYGGFSAKCSYVWCQKDDARFFEHVGTSLFFCRAIGMIERNSRAHFGQFCNLWSNYLPCSEYQFQLHLRLNSKFSRTSLELVDTSYQSLKISRIRFLTRW